MICEKCGKEINDVKICVFNRDGNDCKIDAHLKDCDINCSYFETTSNWCEYDLTEEEINEQIECPECGENPFTDNEVQVYDIVRVVKFKKNVLSDEVNNDRI